MVNRVIQQKIRKKKKGYGRGKRYARFSGETSKFAIKLDAHGRLDKDGKTIEYIVGEVSLSKQVPKTKGGPNSERMQTYYNSVSRSSFKEEIKPRTAPEMEAWLKQYTELLRETPIKNRITLATTVLGKLDLFFSQSAKEWFFIEIQYTECIVRMSRTYSDKKTALDRLRNNRVIWVEQLPIKLAALPTG